jgi:hypothetical protein
MTADNPNRRPVWLSGSWERKKAETADRVRSAIERLTADRQPVTVNAIREAVKAIFNIPFSANTIKRNDEAYALYLSCRRPPRSPAARDLLLSDLYACTTDKAHLYAKVARLRRQSKDHLIAQLISLEQAAKLQTQVENRLREEIVRNSLQSGSDNTRISGLEVPIINTENNSAMTITATTTKEKRDED